MRAPPFAFDFTSPLPAAYTGGMATKSKAARGLVLGGIRSASTRISLLVAFSAVLPIMLIGGGSLFLARYSFENAAFAQIIDALEGANAIVSEYRSLVDLGVMSEQRALSFIRRLFLGDLVEFSVEAEDAAEAEGFFADIARYRPAGSPAPYGVPERFPVRLEGGRAYLSDFLPVLHVKQGFEAMDLRAQASLVNGPRAVRLRFDLAGAAVRIRSSGYVFAITRGRDASLGGIYELFHPTLTMVDVSAVKNSLGEEVGLAISRLDGRRDPKLPEPYLRYDYIWFNQGDPGERKKITLMRDFEPWDLVLAAGLYEDEYFAPLRSILSFMAAGLVLSGLLFYFVAQAFGRSLVGRRVEELDAAFASADAGAAYDFPVDWQDEFGAIARAASRMARAIEEREAALRQAQKREIAGAIAAGMAHDMNNALGAVLGSASLLRAELDGDQDPAAMRAAAAGVEKAAKAAAAQLRSMLDFGRAPEGELRPLELGPVIDEALAMARRSSPPEVRYRWLTASGPATVRGDRVRLLQVYLNAFLNARDAVTTMRPDGVARGGAVGVSLSRGAFEDGTACWAVAVSDDGVGMSAETLTRAFEPFYSSKPMGQGTGLGLAMIRHIARQHGGRARLSSELGAGATLTIELPAVEAERGGRAN